MTLNLNKSFRILRKNYGCPGSDEVSIKEIKNNYWQHKCFIEERLNNNLFQFSSPRFAIVDSRTLAITKRHIFIYSVFDRWVQIAIKLELEKNIQFKDSVFSYIKGVKKVDTLKNLLFTKPKYLLTLDLKRFFESIDRTFLFERLKTKIKDETLIQLAIASISHSEKGLPLGNCISPLLANFYLSEIDEIFPNNYSRYSDDLFFAMNDTTAIDSIIEKVNNIITNHLSLELNLDKIIIYQNPKIENIVDGFPWLLNTGYTQYNFLNKK